MADIEALERIIGREFTKKELGEWALTHSSLVNEPQGVGRKSNETLAVLGDAIIELAIVRALLPDHDTKGGLTNAKQKYVSNRTLADVASGWPLPDGGGGRWFGDKKIRAQLFEATLGAVYLDTDQDLEATAELALRLVGFNEDAAARST